MKCVNCGNELQPGARFCVFCGAHAQESAVTPEAPIASPAEEPFVMDEIGRTTAPKSYQSTPEPTPIPTQEAPIAAPAEEPFVMDEIGRTTAPKSYQSTPEPTPVPTQEAPIAAPAEEPFVMDEIGRTTAPKSYQSTPEPVQQAAPQEVPVTPSVHNEVPEQQTYSSQPAYGEQTSGQQAYSEQTSGQTEQTKTADQPKKKGKKGPLIAVLVLLLLVLAGGGAAAYFLIGGFGSSGAAANYHLSYVKNGKLYYVSDIRKDDEAILITNIKNADSSVNTQIAGTFTDDGTYLYFFSKMEDSSSGKLCRIETSKIKDDEDKNEELTEEIMSGVVTYQLLDNNRFVYKNSSDELYYYDGEDKDKITTDVLFFYCYTADSTDSTDSTESDESADSTGEMVAFYTNSWNYGTYSITDDTLSLNENGASGYTTDNGAFEIRYSDTADDYDLYYMPNGGEAQLVVSNVYAAVGSVYSKDAFCYTKVRTETVSYYDFVNDIYADADAGIANPAATDYMTACTEYDAMSEYEREYYTQYPDSIGSFYYWLYTDYYYNTGMKYTYTYEVDESGNYIWHYFFYDEENAQWYAFDGDAYEAALTAYDAVASRIDLRQELQETTMDLTYYDFYVWTQDGGESLIAADVSPFNCELVGDTGIVLYQRYDAYGKVDMPEEGYRTSFVDDFIYNSRNGEDVALNSYSNYSGTETAWNTEWGIPGSDISFDASLSGNYAMEFVTTYDEDYNSTTTMNAFLVTDGALTLLTKDVASATYGIWVDDDFYYYEAETETEGNLYCCTNGTASVVLKNISKAEVRWYDNGTYTAYADVESGSEEETGTLKLFSAEGEATKIAGNVDSYSYVAEGLIVYVSDGKLCVYRGEDQDKFKIDSSVDAYTCSMEDYVDLLY